MGEQLIFQYNVMTGVFTHVNSSHILGRARPVKSDPNFTKVQQERT